MRLPQLIICDHRCQRGFTLIEMLVAIFIVGLALTVFLQLLAGSMRLAHKSRTLVDYASYADETFSHLLLQDMRNPDFQWSSQTDQSRWQLQLFPVEVKQESLDSGDEIIVKLPAQLYLLTFVLYVAEDRPVITLHSLRRYPIGYFTEDFKQQHVQQIDPLDQKHPTAQEAL